MEVDEIQAQGCNNKFARIGNGRANVVKLGQKGDMQYPEDEEDVGRDVKRNGEFTDFPGSNVVSRLSGWPSSMSRIVRVSRATGGKDRHSKVLTSKGLRDRRVRLSVTTAIQFYDLQDRLGYDQPSKAVEWLLKAAARSIDELPCLNTSFPDSPKQVSGENRCSTGGSEQQMDGDLNNNNNYNRQQQQAQQHSLSLSKSTCSSTSETSRGSRTESRVKARERARGRAAEKEKEIETTRVNPNPNVNQSSFTELLTGQNQREWSMNYFTTEQNHLGNPIQQPSTMFNINHHQELQQFSFVPDHLVPTDLNFSISSSSSGLSDYNRGTLQSNSSSMFQRFSPIDGSNLPFLVGNAENHHQFLPGFDGRLHLCYGDGNKRGKERTELADLIIRKRDE